MNNRWKLVAINYKQFPILIFKLTHTPTCVTRRILCGIFSTNFLLSSIVYCKLWHERIGAASELSQTGSWELSMLWCSVAGNWFGTMVSTSTTQSVLFRRSSDMLCDSDIVAFQRGARQYERWVSEREKKSEKLREIWKEATSRAWCNSITTSYNFWHNNNDDIWGIASKQHDNV